MNAFVYVYSTMPREWMAREMVTGIAAVAPSRDEALKLWESVWNQRAPFTVKDEAPPRPKRPDVALQEDKLLDVDTAFHRSLVRRFHSDLVGDRTFTADQVLAIN
jgi:hypothetical protein